MLDGPANGERFAYVTNVGDGTISSYDVAPDGTLALNAPATWPA